MLDHNKLFINILFLSFILTSWNCSARKKVEGSSKTDQSVNIDFEKDSATVVILNLDSIFTAIQKSSQMKIMKDAGIPGIVEVLIFVDKEANYINHKLIESPHLLATEALTELIPFMRFGIKQGDLKSISEQYTYRFRYKYTTW